MRAADQCGENRNNWICRLEKEHTGNHADCSLVDAFPYFSWSTDGDA